MNKTTTLRRSPSGLFIVTLASLVGLVGFAYPFVLPVVRGGTDRSAHAADAPLVFAILTALSLLAIAVELDGVTTARRSASKTVALLGVLVALDASLRLAPSFLGASPIFLLIVLVGAVFGPTFGFQMGALTLLVSAFITGGVGPWLPYQMLGAGWVGMSAGWVPRFGSPRRWLVALAAFGAGWGLLFGALMNLYFWPYAAPGVESDAGLYWSPSLTVVETVERYARFYVVTSLGFDLFRAAGNAVLILLLGGPILHVLERFRARFAWEPWEAMTDGTERPEAPPLPAEA
ncbi:MAG: ECF transporter S component [Thermomicrobiales bacterium]